MNSSGAERHGALAVGIVAAVVLVAERDTGLIERDEPTVRDGDAVGVSGQIGEHRLRAGERRLGVDDAPLLAEEHVAEEGMAIAQAKLAAEERSRPVAWSGIPPGTGVGRACRAPVPAGGRRGKRSTAR